MSNGRKDVPPQLSRRPNNMRPKSPAEALEPGRAPARPKGVKPRRERKAVSGLVRLVSGIMTILLVMMLGAGALTLLVRHLYERPGPLEVAQTIVIPKGSSSNDIAERLEREGIISSRWAFMINYLFRSRFGPKDVALKHGEYLIKQQASIREVMEALTEGKAVLYKVTVPEGLTSQQIVERLKGEENLTGDVTQVPLEGSLLPETYSIEKGMSRQDLLVRMQAKHRQVAQTVWDRRSPDTPLKSLDEALVLASIIEKETGRSDERERIAGVFSNRLVKGMPLQSDPTILYGIYGGGVQWGKPILQTEKEAKNSHNTYQMKGLPATPICNPGRAALEAAVNPAKTKDLFFVADGQGGHIFTETYKDHTAAVQNWRKLEKEIRARQDAGGEAASNDTKAESKNASKGEAIPNPTAEGATSPAQPLANPVKTIPATTTEDAGEVTAVGQASAVPLPVRKPKK